jgi:hypothetical protein
MRAVKKYAIIAAVIVVAVLGAWTYACCANVPWVSDMARGATHNVALSMGLHVFDPASSTGTEEKKQTVTNLPEGYYLFLGAKPAHSAAKWVVVSPGGGIDWLKTDPAQAPTVMPATGAPTTSATATTGEWEQYNYPTVKWKAKPIPHVDGGVAQLQTTFEPGADDKPGTVKYTLTVLKDPSKRGRRILLLDKDGFKVCEFAASDWQDVAASDFIQARDNFPMMEEDYRRVRDYTVN